MKTLRAMLTDFKTYALHPQYVHPQTDAPDTRKTRVIEQFFAECPLVLSVTILAVGMLLIISYIKGVNSLLIFPANRLNTATSMLTTAFFLVLFIEVLFRLMLRVSPGRMVGAMTVVVFILITVVAERRKEVIDGSFIGWSLLTWLVLSFPISRFLKRPAVFGRIERFWQTHFQWIFYGSSLLYGLFCLKGISLLWLLVLLGPVLLISLYLGYVRMKYGFWYAVFI